DGVCGKVAYIGGNALYFFLGSLVVLAVEKGFGSLGKCFSAVADSLLEAVVPVAFVFALGSFIEVSSMTGVRGYFSLKILPYPETGVILFMMALSVVAGILLSTPLPAFFVSYAVFPIGWLANPVVVAGISMSLAVAPLITLRHSLFSETEVLLGYGRTGVKDKVPAVALMCLLSLVLGVFFVMAGDSTLSFLNF
ncbi:MAG: hypothetical protein ACI4S4_03905, partial [Candidatus Ornithospirochaeta sp.]